MRFTRSSNTHSSSSNRHVTFPDAFWQWYTDSYIKNDRDTLTKHTPYNDTKYSEKSSAVTTVQKYFEHLKLPIPSSYQVIASLKSPFTQGDQIKTVHLIRFVQLSTQGLFLTNSSLDKLGGVIRFAGAENWDNVMCYLDALLFSMFANLESFEPILFIPNAANSEVERLLALLRLYVSLIRSGNLITTDITIRLCESLQKLGFKEAMSHKQQDSAALFEFLTETLSMPLLTFKIDIQHGGKYNKNDDEKFSRERILFVSIPDEEVPSIEIKNTESMEEANSGATTMQANNLKKGDTTSIQKINSENTNKSDTSSHDVNNNEMNRTENASMRTLKSEKMNSEQSTGSQQPGKPGNSSSQNSTNTQKSSDMNSSSDVEDLILLEECLEHYFNNSISVERELERRASLMSIKATGGGGDMGTYTIPEDASYTSSGVDSDFHKLHQEHVENVEEQASLTHRNSGSIKDDGVRVTSRTRSSTLSIWSLNETDRNTGKPREVSLPAWMFLRLLPFYTDDNVMSPGLESVAKNSKEFATRRPILPLCLKRYHFSNSTATRSQKRIIIPPVINLPKFVADDIDGTPSSYKLILESAICHRGKTISLGHFVSVVRKNTEDSFECEDAAYNATWFLYDDMKKHARVVEKTFKEIFSTEWPYMLFYRLVSTEDEVLEITKNPFSAPKGSKGPYWTEDSLSPIPSVSKTPSLISEETRSLIKLNSAPTSMSSIQFPDVLPTDPRFVDIRNKYYWYVTDEEKNYFKEEPSVSKSGSRYASVSLSPQHRRNSQWSNSSSNLQLSALDLLDPKRKASSAISEKKQQNKKSSEQQDLTEQQQQQAQAQKDHLNSPSEDSIWRRAIKIASPSTKLDSTESFGEIQKLESPIPSVSHGEATPSHQEAHHSSHRSHHFYHRYRKKTDAYQEKNCTIM